MTSTYANKISFIATIVLILFDRFQLELYFPLALTNFSNFTRNNTNDNDANNLTCPIYFQSSVGENYSSPYALAGILYRICGFMLPIVSALLADNLLGKPCVILIGSVAYAFTIMLFSINLQFCISSLHILASIFYGLGVGLCFPVIISLSCLSVIGLKSNKHLKHLRKQIIIICVAIGGSSSLANLILLFKEIDKIVFTYIFGGSVVSIAMLFVSILLFTNKFSKHIHQRKYSFTQIPSIKEYISLFLRIGPWLLAYMCLRLAEDLLRFQMIGNIESLSYFKNGSMENNDTISSKINFYRYGDCLNYFGMFLAGSVALMIGRFVKQIYTYKSSIFVGFGFALLTGMISVVVSSVFSDNFRYEENYLMVAFSIPIIVNGVSCGIAFTCVCETIMSKTNRYHITHEIAITYSTFSLTSFSRSIVTWLCESTGITYFSNCKWIHCGLFALTLLATGLQLMLKKFSGIVRDDQLIDTDEEEEEDDRENFIEHGVIEENATIQDED